MENLKKLVFFICLSLIVSCSDASDDDLGISGEGALSATVAGSSFTSLQATVGATVTNGVAAIQGSNSSGEFIRINISSYNGTGTYKTGDNLSNTSSISYGTINPVATWMSTFNLGTGTIEITEETDTTITGTFSFTGINASAGNSTKSVTAGKFSAPKN